MLVLSVAVGVSQATLTENATGMMMSFGHWTFGGVVSVAAKKIKNIDMIMNQI